jgi:heat shock protein HslJ
MQKVIFIFLITCCLLAACNSTKKTTAPASDPANLAGTWELNYVSGSTVLFDSLYHAKKPTINFDVNNNTVSGNTGCNNFNGKLDAAGNKINFNSPMALTKMFCPGEGENVFLATLKKVNAWSVSDGKTLTFISGDTALMRFTKK